jgi:hypothetical protein
VSGRYHFGEIRLRRLNFYCKFILGKRRIHRIHTTYGEYFSRFFGPVLFLFAAVSVMLNAFQVELAVEPLVTSRWPAFWSLSRLAAVLSLFICFVLFALLFSLFLFRFTAEWHHAIQTKLKYRNAKRNKAWKSKETGSV